MTLDDALLYFILDAESLGAAEAAARAASAIAGGADVIQIGAQAGVAVPDETIAAVVKICREQDALALTAGDPAAAVAARADGVTLLADDVSVGVARAALQENQLLGLYGRSVSEATLALELMPEFLVYFGGAECVSLFHLFRAQSAVTLYAAGFGGVEEAKPLVDSGILRLTIESRRLDRGRDMTEQVAEYSRLIGRSL